MRRDRVIRYGINNNRQSRNPGHNRHLHRPLSSSSTVLRQTNCLRATEFVGYAFPVCECATGRTKQRDFISVSRKWRVNSLIYNFPFPLLSFSFLVFFKSLKIACLYLKFFLNIVIKIYPYIFNFKIVSNYNFIRFKNCVIMIY